jgi:hypothetical protein
MKENDRFAVKPCQKIDSPAAWNSLTALVEK